MLLLELAGDKKAKILGNNLVIVSGDTPTEMPFRDVEESLNRDGYGSGLNKQRCGSAVIGNGTGAVARSESTLNQPLTSESRDRCAGSTPLRSPKRNHGPVPLVVSPAGTGDLTLSTRQKARGHLQQPVL